MRHALLIQEKMHGLSGQVEGQVQPHKPKRVVVAEIPIPSEAQDVPENGCGYPPCEFEFAVCVKISRTNIDPDARGEYVVEEIRFSAPKFEECCP